MQANYKMTVAALAGVGLGVLVTMVSGTETTVAQDTVRVRGTIERLDGSTYVVKARDGAELKVALADNPQIAGVVKASLSDIKQGSFVGVMAVSRSFLCERRTLSLRDSRRAYAFRPPPITTFAAVHS